MRQMTTITVEQMHHEWTEHYHLVRWWCRTRLFRFGNSHPHDIGEHVSEAIAHAWQVYPRLRERRPEFCARVAMCLAAKTGVSRVCARTRFVPKPHRRYIDALDRRTSCGEFFLLEIPQHLQDPIPMNPQDRSTVDTLIDVLPAHLQPIARLLSYGMTRRAVARSRGISETTLRVKIHDIRRELVGLMCERHSW